jgi:epoxyqueuosine reductase
MNTSAPTPTPTPLLLHACCGPCAAHCIEAARAGGFAPTLCYANDNLADAAEYARRLEALRTVAAHAGVPLLVPDYDPAAWHAAIAGHESAPEGGARCAVCFRHNLDRTAREAAARGFAAFTSTLTVSPHKRSTVVFEAGRAAAAALGPDGPAFIALDFKKRGGFLRSTQLARDLGLYRQDFCGCAFSARSRRPSGPARPATDT